MWNVKCKLQISWSGYWFSIYFVRVFLCKLLPMKIFFLYCGTLTILFLRFIRVVDVIVEGSFTMVWTRFALVYWLQFTSLTSSLTKRQRDPPWGQHFQKIYFKNYYGPIDLQNHHRFSGNSMLPSWGISLSLGETWC